jgi:F0F1-type ATP synthase delta subunit
MKRQRRKTMSEQPEHNGDRSFEDRVELLKEILQKEPMAENLFNGLASKNPDDLAQKILELSDEQCDYLDHFIRIILLRKGRKFCGKIIEQLKQKADKEKNEKIAKIFLDQIILIASPLRSLYGITEAQAKNL